jgi:hypothetical protein
MVWNRTGKLLQRYHTAEPAQLRGMVAAQLEQTPTCGLSRYLLGCLSVDAGQVALGTRHFMIAHHQEPQYRSAALLVFTGLAWSRRTTDAFLPVLLDTWEEFRHPAFDIEPREQALFDAFGETFPGDARATPLAARLWRLPIRTLRTALREALAHVDQAPLTILKQSA